MRISSGLNQSQVMRRRTLDARPRTATIERRNHRSDDQSGFSLPFVHPGHKHFEGCSGAPVLSSEGSLVVLVCSGCEKTNEIRGISVQAYKTAIDILVGNVG